jgi:hypothetical protein
VERALTLIADGTLTIDVARASNSKTVTLPSCVNPRTGRESKTETGFNLSTWGAITNDYTKSALALNKDKFDAIVQDAQLYNIKQNHARKLRKEVDEVTETGEGERACLVSESDDDDW